MLNSNKGFWILLPIPFKYIYPAPAVLTITWFRTIIKWSIWDSLRINQDGLRNNLVNSEPEQWTRHDKSNFTLAVNCTATVTANTVAKDTIPMFNIW